MKRRVILFTLAALFASVTVALAANPHMGTWKLNEAKSKFSPGAMKNNTVVYEDEDIYRGQERRDVILLNPEDMRRLKLVENQRVTVRSAVGSLPNILARSFPEIRAGNALMYYPEANVLVPRHADPQSRTPTFKSVVVSLEASLPVAAAAT